MAATDMLRGRQTATRVLTNKSGGSVAVGDVVVIGDGTNDKAFTTTTTAHFRARAIGVAMEAIASNAAGLVAISGYVPKIVTSGAVTRDQFLYTHTVAKQATGSTLFVPGAFAQVLNNATSPEAILFGMPQRGAVELDYVEITADVSLTATTEATGNTVITANALALDGATKIEIDFFAPALQPPSGANLSSFLTLVDGGTSLGIIAHELNNNATNAIRSPVTVTRRITPAAATKTYGIEGYVTSGTGTVKAGTGVVTALMPAFIKITAV